MKFFALSETCSHCWPLKEKFPALILLIISLSFFPVKGCFPDNKIYKITPQLQISHFSSYILSNTSGAI